MMMNLNTNMNSNLTQMCCLVRVCVLGWYASVYLSCTKALFVDTLYYIGQDNIIRHKIKLKMFLEWEPKRAFNQ